MTKMEDEDHDWRHPDVKQSSRDTQSKTLDARIRVLVVNLSGVFRKVLVKMLSEMRFKSLEAMDGTDALTKLDEYRDIGLILLDWHLPTMDGMDLLEKLKLEKERFSSPTIVMISKENNRDHIAKAMALGAKEYIMRPFTKEILQDKLALLGLKGIPNG